MGEAGDPVEPETGDQLIAWPRSVRWLAVAHVLSYVVGTVGFLALGVLAAAQIARHPRIDIWAVVTVAAAGACPAAGAAFRRWFRSWGRRRWPAAKPVAETPAAPDPGPPPPSPKAELGGRPFFLGLGLVCLALGGAGLAWAASEAVAESRLTFRAVPTGGTVIDTRMVREGKGHRKEGLVEYTVGGRSNRQWLRLTMSSDGGPGKTVPVWYDPEAEMVAGQPPDPVGKWLVLPPFYFFTVLGLCVSGVMIHLLVLGEPLTTGPPYPDMTSWARVALLVFGGLGVLAFVVLLFVVFGFAALHSPNESPADRWHSIQIAIGSNRGAFGLAFLLLTGLVLLCVKAIGRDPQLAANTGRHVLISSGLAVAVVAAVMSLVAFGFGFQGAPSDAAVITGLARERTISSPLSGPRAARVAMPFSDRNG